MQYKQMYILVNRRFDIRVPKSLVISFLLSSALGLLPHAANAIIIDEFSQNYNEKITVSDVGTSKQRGVVTSSAIGGARRAIVKKVAGSDIGDVSHYILKTENLEPRLVHSQDTGEYGSTTTIWDGASTGNSINTSGLGRIDFTVDNSGAIVIKFAGGDMKVQQGSTIIISVYKNGVEDPYTYTIANTD